jgi:hypothetical protein
MSALQVRPRASPATLQAISHVWRAARSQSRPHLRGAGRCSASDREAVSARAHILPAQALQISTVRCDTDGALRTAVRLR